ncbi:VWA domain-containing protein [Marinobacter salinexigens]|nr:VWA domain-containing protein [Marinobacter salinexigens]
MADFHFLRPVWLLVLLAVPLLYLTIRHLRSGDSGWSRLIPQAFLTPLLRHNGQAGTKRRSPVLPAIAAMTLLSIALAGPAWREAPTPLKKPGDSLVIVLDLSLSMLATDVEPDRLTLAKRKIRDILATREGSLNGLIVFSADAHVVTPLTDDRQTIEAMLDVLDPMIMPAAGNRADLAIEQAKALLQQGAPGKGRILLLSDDIQARYFDTIRESLADTGFSLSTLTIGTRAGGPIPLAKRGFIRDNGDVVISKADPEGLAFLASKTHGASHTLTLDDTDIQALGLSPDSLDSFNTDGKWQDPEEDLTVRRWQDDGYWLLWLILPLLVLGWRRGAFAVIAVILLPLSTPQPAQAMDWDSLWQREDQRAPTLIEQDPEQAAKNLDSPAWRGSAQYRSNQFDEAARTFAQVPGARADFNRGNALAKAGKLQESIDAYNEALSQNPDMEDATFNRDLVKKLLEQQKQQQNKSGKNQNSSQQDQSQQDQQQNQDGESNQDQNGQQQQNQSGQNDQQDKGEQSQQPSESEQQQNGESSEQQSEPQQPQQADDSNQTEQPSEPTSQAPSEISEQPLSQGQEQWLRRVPDNPGGLLRRKFLQQYQERQTPSDEGDTPW